MEISQELLVSWGIKIGIALAILVVGKFIVKAMFPLTVVECEIACFH